MRSLSLVLSRLPIVPEPKNSRNRPELLEMVALGQEMVGMRGDVYQLLKYQGKKKEPPDGGSFLLTRLTYESDGIHQRRVRAVIRPRVGLFRTAARSTAGNPISSF